MNEQHTPPSGNKPPDGLVAAVRELNQRVSAYLVARDARIRVERDVRDQDQAS
jgi:hypothetical protein